MLDIRHFLNNIFGLQWGIEGHLLEYSITSFDYLVQRKIDNIHDDFAVAILDQKNGNIAGQEITSD